MQNIGNGQLAPRSVSPNYIPLVFQNRVGAGLLFQDFEQWQTATDLAQKFFDPLHKRAREYLNGQICSLITPANFNANAPIIGGTQGYISVAEGSTAWSTLQDQKVPEDPDKMHLAMHNDVYRKVATTAEWVQESLVGIAIAERARTKAEMADSFNFEQVWDQQMPTASGTIIYGQVQPINGSATVTGTATAFTSDLAVGQALIFGCDGTKTQYPIASIQSDVSLTLSTSYTGVTPTNAGVNTPTTARRITNLVGTVAVSTNTGTVTGTRTAFTAAMVGGWLQFTGDTTGAYYQITAVSSATSITIAPVALAAANGSGQTATFQQYSSLAYHEYAIALALRPIATPPEAGKVLDVTYLDLMGIPVRVMVSYQHIYQGLFVTVDYGYALAVIRPDFGVLHQA